MKHISFGSIEQFRNVVKAVTLHTRYVGKDDEGNPIYDNNITLPIVTATATEKIHGTNAAVCFHKDKLWVQSKSKIITPEDDNAGCAAFVYDRIDEWKEIIFRLAIFHDDIDLDSNILSVFFEWCGGNIQKNSAASGLYKRAVIFQHFKVSPIDDNENSKWHETAKISNKEKDIYNIMSFPHWEFEIDFNTPQLYQNQILDKVKEIENKSPFGESFGINDNVGEGLVLTFEHKDNLYRFKVKGEKHSVTKVKTLKPVDEEREKAKIEFANYACSSSRLEQAWQTVFGINDEALEPDIKHTRDFLRAVVADVVKEETDVLQEGGLTQKEVNSTISKIARTWFMEQLNKL